MFSAKLLHVLADWFCYLCLLGSGKPSECKSVHLNQLRMFTIHNNGGPKSHKMEIFQGPTNILQCPTETRVHPNLSLPPSPTLTNWSIPHPSIIWVHLLPWVHPSPFPLKLGPAHTHPSHTHPLSHIDFPQRCCPPRYRHPH